MKLQLRITIKRSLEALKHKLSTELTRWNIVTVSYSFIQILKKKVGLLFKTLISSYSRHPPVYHQLSIKSAKKKWWYVLSRVLTDILILIQMKWRFDRYRLVLLNLVVRIGITKTSNMGAIYYSGAKLAIFYSSNLGQAHWKWPYKIGLKLFHKNQDFELFKFGNFWKT